jgi:hypothetical protein
MTDVETNEEVHYSSDIPNVVDQGEDEISKGIDYVEDQHVVKKEGDHTEDVEELDEDEEDDTVFAKYKKLARMAIKAGLLLLLVVYLLAAFIIDFERATFLFVATVLVLVYMAYYYWASKNEEIVDSWESNMFAFFEKTETDRKYGLGATAVLVGIMVILMAVGVKDARNLVSLFGLLVFIFLTWIFSWKPMKVKVRPVLGALFLQFIFGYIVIRTSWGLAVIQWMADNVTYLLSYTVAGSSFVFNWLTDGSLFGTPFRLANGDEYGLPPPFFFNVLPTVIFFSALVSILYYLRVLPWLVKKVGKYLSMRKCLFLQTKTTC